MNRQVGILPKKLLAISLFNNTLLFSVRSQKLIERFGILNDKI
jgi:hypothetical protein